MAEKGNNQINKQTLRRIKIVMTSDILPNYRPGTLEDTTDILKIFARSLLDFEHRSGYRDHAEPPGEADVKQTMDFFRSIFMHLSETVDQLWIAEIDGRPVGYARSIVRDGYRELTDLFVLPGVQSSGVGRELLKRAFPKSGVRGLSIIATTDLRAQAAYLKSGLYPQFPIYHFGREPETTNVTSDITIQSGSHSTETTEVIASIDLDIVGYRRDIDHGWLMTNRTLLIYERNGQAVGYGYVGENSSGPFALLENDDYPAVLAHAENFAHERGYSHFGIQVPMINRQAIDYLLSHGYRMDPFLAFLMLDNPSGKFTNYIMTSPEFFI